MRTPHGEVRRGHGFARNTERVLVISWLVVRSRGLAQTSPGGTRCAERHPTSSNGVEEPLRWALTKRVIDVEDVGCAP
jgi:hypothetical protein